MFRYSLVQKNKSTGNLFYSIRITDTDTHKTKFISTHTKNKKLALEIMDKVQHQELHPTEKRSVPTLEEGVKKFIDYTINTAQSRRTILDYTNQAKSLLQYAQTKEIHLDNIDKLELLQEFQKATENFKPSTKKQRRSIWVICFNWIIKNYDLNIKNPMDGIKPPKAPRIEKTFFTPEEIETILDKAETKEIRLLFSFMAFEGLRFSEAKNLKYEDITDGIKVIGKGQKFAKIPLSDRMKAELEKFSSDKKSGFIFDRVKFPNNTINRHLHKITKILGIEKETTLHTFRHSFASNLLRAGANIVSVSKLMRHENPQITLAVYSHVIPNDLDKTINILK
ncbi:MAG: tyrosine-type recombinase/integrase [Bacilli bacterium]|nr:tyrosine-type recombinase/integrase [Bacilli bacterium]